MFNNITDTERTLFELISNMQIGDVFSEGLLKLPMKDILEGGHIKTNHEGVIESFDSNLLSLQTGDELLCIDPCSMSDGQDSLTVGKVYTVKAIEVIFDSIVFGVIDDEGMPHGFKLCELYKFFEINVDWK